MHQRMELQNQVAHWAKTNLENLNIVATYNVIGNSPIQFVKQGLVFFKQLMICLIVMLKKVFLLFC